MRLKSIIFIGIILTSLSGCSHSDVYNEFVEYESIWIPEVSKDSEVMVYSDFDHRLVIYDVEEMSKKELRYEENVFHYQFNPRIDIYTAGHSLENRFTIFEIENNDIQILYEADEDEGIFPLAEQDEILLFVRSCYYETENGIAEQRKISRFDKETKTFYDFKNTAGLICNGVIFNRKLFYSSYDTLSGHYNLYSLDYLDLESSPELIEEGFSNRTVLSSKRGVFVTDVAGDKLTNIYDKFKLDRVGQNQYIDEYNDVLIQLYVDKNSDLSLEIAKLSDASDKICYTNVVTYKIDENKITIYGNGYIEEGDLNW